MHPDFANDHPGTHHCLAADQHVIVLKEHLPEKAKRFVKIQNKFKKWKFKKLFRIYLVGGFLKWWYPKMDGL